jgi:hypothetical protein
MRDSGHSCHTSSRRGAFATALLLVVTALGAVGVSSASAAPNPGTVVVHWNRVAVAATRTAGHLSPVQVIELAIVHAAVYDAVNSIDGRYTPYAIRVADASPAASQEAAAATAAYRVLLNLFPNQAATFDAEYQASLAKVPNGPSKDAGVSVGEQAAAAIIALRSNDGRFANVPYEPGSGPGAWIPTPPFPPDFPALVPWVAYVTPFTLRAPDQFAAGPPPALTSAQYTADFEEVRIMGAFMDSGRTEEQTAIAEFFGEPPDSAWNRTVRHIALERKQSVADNARLFALVNLASADAQITTWRDKYRYGFWRPITAIRAADTDGNPDTTADPTWRPLLVTPPFPEYTSGHAIATGAVTEVLAKFFGTDRFRFTMSSTYSGATRSYKRFSDVTQDVIDGRVWGGSHFRTADVVGAANGSRLGRWVFRNVAVPVT